MTGRMVMLSIFYIFFCFCLIGNCNPRFLRMTTYQIPTSEELMEASCIPLGLVIQPLAKLRADEVKKIIHVTFPHSTILTALQNLENISDNSHLPLSNTPTTIRHPSTLSTLARQAQHDAGGARATSTRSCASPAADNGSCVTCVCSRTISSRRTFAT